MYPGMFWSHLKPAMCWLRYNWDQTLNSQHTNQSSHLRPLTGPCGSFGESNLNILEKIYHNITTILCILNDSHQIPMTLITWWWQSWPPSRCLWQSWRRLRISLLRSWVCRWSTRTWVLSYSTTHILVVWVEVMSFGMPFVISAVPARLVL